MCLMSDLGLSPAQEARFYERVTLQVENIARTNATEEQKLRMIGFFVTGTIAALQAELSSAPFLQGESKEHRVVYVDIEPSPVREYDRDTLDLLAARDRELRARGVSDDERKRLLSQFQYELLIRVPDLPQKVRPSIQPSVLPSHDDTTLTRLAHHDATLKRLGCSDAERRMYLETCEAGELLIQASDRTR